MKTQFNQILTVVAFFTMSLASVVGVSWGFAGLVYCDSRMEEENKQIFQVQIKSNTNHSMDDVIKLLIPKIINRK